MALPSSTSTASCERWPAWRALPSAAAPRSSMRFCWSSSHLIWAPGEAPSAPSNGSKSVMALPLSASSCSARRPVPKCSAR
eukprot:304983-Prymnesium_polylepis.2